MCSRFKNFCRCRKIALHYESAEWAESSKKFKFLTDKKLDYFLSDLKLIFNQQNQQKIELRRRFT